MHPTFNPHDPIETTVVRDIGRFARPRRNRSGPWANPTILEHPNIDAWTF
jgi:hypothetical protein